MRLQCCIQKLIFVKGGGGEDLGYGKNRGGGHDYTMKSPCVTYPFNQQAADTVWSLSKGQRVHHISSLRVLGTY